MSRYNILVGCDQNYFDNWAKVLFESIHYHAPWINLHCHIINPSSDNKISYVDITSNNIHFDNEDSKISYLQSARFLAVNEKFSKSEFVITLDADSICTHSMTEDKFSLLFEKQYVLQHPKDFHWLAGFITFNDNGFRKEYADELCKEPVSEWKFGRDQTVLSKLSKEYNYIPLPKKWMSIGKNSANSYFLTLKGDQKETEKYLKRYRIYQNVLKWGL